MIYAQIQIDYQHYKIQDHQVSHECEKGGDRFIEFSLIIGILQFQRLIF